MTQPVTSIKPTVKSQPRHLFKIACIGGEQQCVIHDRNPFFTGVLQPLTQPFRWFAFPLQEGHMVGVQNDHLPSPDSARAASRSRSRAALTSSSISFITGSPRNIPTVVCHSSGPGSAFGPNTASSSLAMRSSMELMFGLLMACAPLYLVGGAK